METAAVCSWSLEPVGPRDLAEKVRRCGLRAVQLALDPIRTGEWSEQDTVQALNDAGVSIVSGMMGTLGEDYSTLDTIRVTGGIRPDHHWPANRSAAARNAEIARSLGLSLVTLHAGFLPHDRNDSLRATMLGRLRELGDIFASRGISIALETGQEDAPTLLQVLHDLDTLGRPVGVNFDPANMILYGMGDPVAAITTLASHVRQIHIKDALPSPTPGHWGQEVVAGTGAVPWREFLSIARTLCPGAPLVIEREAGSARVEDVIAARNLLASLGHTPRKETHGQA